MSTASLLLAACLAITPSTSSSGVISGIVVNGSQRETPLAGAKVVLRVADQGALLPWTETTTDARGHFVLSGLPLGSDQLYLPGANLDGVHYPGPRVVLGPRRTSARVKVVAYDTIAAPSPLVALQHDIIVRVQTGLLEVTESLLVSNPSLRTYVGQQVEEGVPPPTLRLSLAEGFEKVTFNREFHGRNFKVVDGALVTDIPWTPGQRELQYSYLIPNAQRHRVLQRPLDLPCSHVRMRVISEQVDEVACNLPSLTAAPAGEVLFQHQGKALPAGHVIQVELGRLPMRFMAYARWCAVAVLALMVLATAVTLRWRSRVTAPRSPKPARAGRRIDAAHTARASTTQKPPRTARRPASRRRRR